MKMHATDAASYFRPHRPIAADPMFFFMLITVLLAVACTITLHNMLPRASASVHRPAGTVVSSDVAAR